MDPKVLERLLLDRALGALDADAAALLDAYLAGDPALAAQVTELTRTVGLARQALASDEAPPSLPPFPQEREAVRATASRWSVRLQATAGVAAAIVVGFALGAVAFRGAALPSAGPGGTEPAVVQHSDPPVSPAPAIEPATPDATSVPRALASGRNPEFWSATRLYRRAERNASDGHARLIWHSAVAEPKVGGDL